MNEVYQEQGTIFTEAMNKVVNHKQTTKPSTNPGFALMQESAFFKQILRAGRKNDKLHAFSGRKFHKSMKIQTAHLADTTCQYGPAVNNKRSFTETQQTKIALLPCNRHIIPYQILS